MTRAYVGICMILSEYLSPPPHPWGCHSMVVAVQIRTVPGPTLCLNGLETLWIRSSPDFCKSDTVPGCLFLSCQSTDSDQIGSNLCWICAGPKLFEAAEIPNYFERKYFNLNLLGLSGRICKPHI